MAIPGASKHGRIETRRVIVVHDIGWLQERHKWPGLAGLVIVEATREADRVSRRETRHDLTSAKLDAKDIGPIVRDHRAVENGLHWGMDMTFRDHACRIRTDNAPENFVTLKHMPANLGRKSRPKHKGQGFPPPSPQNRSLGRRPRQAHIRIKAFPRFP